MENSNYSNMRRSSSLSQHKKCLKINSDLMTPSELEMYVDSIQFPLGKRAKAQRRSTGKSSIRFTQRIKITDYNKVVDCFESSILDCLGCSNLDCLESKILNSVELKNLGHLEANEDVSENKTPETYADNGTENQKLSEGELFYDVVYADRLSSSRSSTYCESLTKNSHSTSDLDDIAISEQSTLMLEDSRKKSMPKQKQDAGCQCYDSILEDEIQRFDSTLEDEISHQYEDISNISIPKKNKKKSRGWYPRSSGKGNFLDRALRFLDL